MLNGEKISNIHSIWIKVENPLWYSFQNNENVLNGKFRDNSGAIISSIQLYIKT